MFGLQRRENLRATSPPAAKRTHLPSISRPIHPPLPRAGAAAACDVSPRKWPVCNTEAEAAVGGDCGSLGG